MNAVRVLLVAGLLACGAPAVAQDEVAQDGTQRAAQAAQATLAGEYHLDGVMETGSGLSLRDDGSFEWFFTYGALDLGARGKWTREADTVVLHVDEMGFPPQLPETKFDRMTLRVDGDSLVPAWPWDMDAFRKGEERGSYERQ
jgi:hypothetical protein